MGCHSSVEITREDAVMGVVGWLMRAETPEVEAILAEIAYRSDEGAGLRRYTVVPSYNPETPAHESFDRISIWNTKGQL